MIKGLGCLDSDKGAWTYKAALSTPDIMARNKKLLDNLPSSDNGIFNKLFREKIARKKIFYSVSNLQILPCSSGVQTTRKSSPQMRFM